MQSAFQHFGVRAYRVTNPKLFDKTIAELEAMPKETRVFISRVRHDGAIVEPELTTVIHPGDVVAVATRTELLMARGIEIGPEADDKDLLDFPQEHLDVVVTNKALAGKTLQELAAFDFSRGVFLRKLMRLTEPMPFTTETRIDRGDVLSLVGAKRDVERAAKELGYADRPVISTDMIFVGLGIFFGGLVGLLTVTIGGLPITLTASGGALVMGLVFGWLRSIRPTFGRIPEPAMWVFDTVGTDGLHGRGGSERGSQLHRRASEIGDQPGLRGPGGRHTAPHHGDSCRTIYLEDEPPDPPGRLFRGRDDHRGAPRRPGGIPEQAPGAGVHRALCPRQHPAHGLGAGDCGHDGLSGDPRRPAPRNIGRRKDNRDMERRDV